MFLRRPPNTSTTHKHAVGVFLFVVVWGGERKGREQVFPEQREEKKQLEEKKQKQRE